MNRKIPPLTTFLCVLFASVCFGSTKSPKQTSFPFKVSEGGLLLIQVAANNGIKGKFIFDTGAGIHVLSNSFLQKLGAEAAGQYTGFRNTGERIDFDLFRISSLSIGQFRQERPIVAAWDVLDKFKIDGVLSAKFFEHRVITLDFKQHELSFENRNTLPRRLRQGRIVPLKVSQDRERVLGLFVDLSVGNSLTCECELDTGFDGLVILDSRFMKMLKLDESSPEVKKTGSKGITGLSEVRYEASVPSIALLRAPEIMEQKSEVTFKQGLIYDGVLGSSFWSNRRITFDIPHRRLIVNMK